MKCVFSLFTCPVPPAYETDTIQATTLAQFCQACPIIKVLDTKHWLDYIEITMELKEESS